MRADNEDLKIRRFTISQASTVLIYLEGLCDEKKLGELVLAVQQPTERARPAVRDCSIGRYLVAGSRSEQIFQWRSRRFWSDKHCCGTGCAQALC